jgi:hypothetical protein
MRFAFMVGFVAWAAASWEAPAHLAIFWISTFGLWLREKPFLNFIDDPAARGVWVP